MSERREAYHVGMVTASGQAGATEPADGVAKAIRAETETWHYPRLARIYWQCACERCVANEIMDAIDTSEGLPAYVEIVCPDCERELRFHINWAMPEIHSIQLVEIHDPFFPDVAVS